MVYFIWSFNQERHCFNMAGITSFVIFLFIVRVDTHPKVDLTFVVDTSRHMENSNLRLAFNFIVQFLEHYSISRSNTRVALLTFSNKAHFRFHFIHSNRKCTVKAIRELQVRIRASKSSIGFSSAFHKILNFYQRLSRRDAHRYVVLLTSTRTLGIVHRNFLLYVRSKLRTWKIKLRTIGFGKRSRRLELMKGRILKRRKDINKLLRLLFWNHRTYTACRGNGIRFDECNRKCQCIRGKLQKCRRIRKEYTTLTKDEKELFINAMKYLASSELYKTRYEQLTIIHLDSFWKGIHRKKHFFPWHRWYLLLMENLLQELDCRITLPFWDWSFWSAIAWQAGKHLWSTGKHGFGGDGIVNQDFCIKSGSFRQERFKTPKYVNCNKVYNLTSENYGLTVKPVLPHPRCIRRRFNGIPPHTIEVERTLLMSPHRFSDFEMIIRADYHNLIHCAIGGTMCSNYASSTPEFWLHHTMLDYLWFRWQKRGRQYRDVFYKNKRYRLISTNRTPKELLDSYNQPGCVAVEYKLFGLDMPTPRGKGMTSFKRMYKNLMLDPSYKRDTAREQGRKLFGVSNEEAKRIDKLRDELMHTI